MENVTLLREMPEFLKAAATREKPPQTSIPCHPWEPRHSNIHKNNRNSKCQAVHTGLTSSRPNEWQQPLDEVQPAPGEVRGHIGRIKLSYSVVPSESLQRKQLLGSMEERRLNDEDMCMLASSKHALNHAQGQCGSTRHSYFGAGVSGQQKERWDPTRCRGMTENSSERQEAGLMHQVGLKLND